MTEKFKILGKYIKDLSSETKDVETYLFVKDNISKYNLNIDITSKVIKEKIIEINTTLKFSDKDPNEKKSHFEIVYATIIKVSEDITDYKINSITEKITLQNNSSTENDFYNEMALYLNGGTGSGSNTEDKVEDNPTEASTEGDTEGGKNSTGKSGPPVAETDAASKKGLDALRDKGAGDRIYGKIPKVDLKNIVVDPKTLLTEFTTYYNIQKAKDVPYLNQEEKKYGIKAVCLHHKHCSINEGYW